MVFFCHHIFLSIPSVNVIIHFKVCGVTGRSYTYGRLRDHSAAFAVRLQKQLKLQRNDVIAICMPNTPDYPIAMFGSIEAGLVVTTMNPIYTARTNDYHFSLRHIC